MSSKLAALALTAGISLPGLPAIPTYSAIDQIPVVGPAIVQTYKQLPPQVQRAIHLPLPLTAPAAAKRQPTGKSATEVQAQLDQLVRDVVARHGGRATASVGGITAGDNRPESAFSTMKVPVAIGALRKSPAAYPDAEVAVTRSDNPAAHRMFGQVSGAELDGIIAEAGSRTTNSAGYQMGTLWTTSDQAAFASGLRCVKGHEPVLDMMGRVVDYQRWGVGRIPGARFKGGWNYYENGHLARQFGLIPGPNGDIAVAITVHSPKGHEGSFAMLNELADGIAAMRGDLPTARC
ncbi:hypothetical protein [Corynebacterium coyleae]|uniref:hypothetical protein n=1 Tax=Corynebacterium coyleae TaxID=53374 RepID=UPI002550EEE4|nr:hypothetical protein [Corynebacterium coyleae]MDK8663626.1 hypothetical protein [Corynebacterium coyleae]MDK8706538.1 hypothetical protein [Corynebacterium coyleae]MDK8733428.1 hypothetical protein [Corynebacterium coyleae]MDK8892624.1 hypothetical protein [Corynebacterium coyleae]